MPRFIDQAICIRSSEWSESSQLVVLLTREHGKVRGLAKGSKRQSPSSVQRFSGGIELLTHGQVIATTRPTRELASVTEWNLQNDFFSLRRDLQAQQLAMYAADVIHAMTADLDPHETIYTATLELLEFLTADNGDGSTRWPVALLRFHWTLLDTLGYRPELKRDIRGDQPLEDSGLYTFDPVAGGFTAEQGPSDWRVRQATLRALRLTAGKPEHGQSDLAGEMESAERANRLLAAYCRSLIGRELPTMNLIFQSSASG
jgi:DNA repair protein RecO (recombination protein O)